MKALLALLAAACFAQAQPPPQAPPAPSTLAIRDARIVTVSGATLDKGTVVIRDGLIADVGPGAAIPAGAWIVDGEGLTVYPGLIDALSVWGLPAALTPATGGRGGRGGAPQPAAPNAPAGRAQQTNSPLDRPATTSWLRAGDELQPNETVFERARTAGFTSAAAFPTRGIFAGQGSLINLAGSAPRDMVLEPALGQYITMNPSGTGYPASLMGTISYIRQVYLDAERYRLLQEDYARDPRGKKRPDYDRALEGVLASRRILLPAGSRVEVDRMLRLAQELKQPALLYGLEEGYRSADLLAAANATVLVSLRWPERPRDPDPAAVESLRTLENRDRAPSTPAELIRAGVRFAFCTGGLEQARDIQRAVKKAIDAGLSRADAVRALTLWPAQIYGVDSRLGSIEPGKIANLAVTRGEIFDDNTKVEMVFIDGRQYRPPPEPAKPKPGGAP
jgi:hypothetical protein